MIGRVALLVTFKKAKPKQQRLSRSNIRDLCNIDDQIVLNNKTLQEILNVANAVSSRGKGISMHQALSKLAVSYTHLTLPTKA